MHIPTYNEALRKKHRIYQESLNYGMGVQNLKVVARAFCSLRADKKLPMEFLRIACFQGVFQVQSQQFNIVVERCCTVLSFFFFFLVPPVTLVTAH